jgi:hypothetical protein
MIGVRDATASRAPSIFVCILLCFYIFQLTNDFFRTTGTPHYYQQPPTTISTTTMMNASEGQSRDKPASRAQEEYNADSETDDEGDMRMA